MSNVAMQCHETITDFGLIWIHEIVERYDASSVYE